MPTHRPSASAPRPACRAGPAGFTLLELLVAIGIMAMISIIAWRGLSSLIATRDRLSPETDDVRSLLTGFGQMQLDLAQATSPALLSLGGSPVRIAEVDGSPTLRILRLAPLLPDGASAVQQVVYSVQDGRLVRQATTPARSLAALSNTVPAGLPLIAGVASIQVRFWRANQGWVVPAEADLATPPGVEVELTRSDGSRYRRVMLVG
jgi:general secretion pathway protein J